MFELFEIEFVFTKMSFGPILLKKKKSCDYVQYKQFSSDRAEKYTLSIVLAICRKTMF